MERQIAFNRTNIFCSLFGLLIAVIGLSLVFDKEMTDVAVFFLAVGLFLVFMFGFIFPLYYAFDREGISICYVFGRKQHFYWKKVKSVTYIIDSYRGFIDKYLFACNFQIKGEPDKKPRFYMEGRVAKTRKTEKLFEEYAADKLVNFKGKKKSEVIKSEDDCNRLKAVAEAERNVREQAEKIISRYYGELSNIGLCLKVRYAYFSDGDDEMKEYTARPDGDCTYSLITEISKPGETDEDKIIYWDIDLLSLKMRSNGIKISNNDTAQDAFSSLDECVEELKRVGIDKYLEE